MYWLLLIPLAAILVISAWTYRIAFYSPKRGRSDPYDPVEGEQYVPFTDRIMKATRLMDSQPFEPIWITAKDGTRLFGRYYHSADGAPLEILFHGYRSTALRDSSGGHALAMKLKFNTLVVDQRAHGISAGRTITFGIKERWDCLSWIEYANRRFGDVRPIVISGLSMGAATVLMAADLPLPENVRGIIADCPYSSPEAILKEDSSQANYPTRLAYPFIRLGGLLWGGFDIQKTSAVRAVQNAKVPVLLIHGTADYFVPCHMSEEICNACASQITFCRFPNAGHGLAYMSDPPRYEKECIHFLSQIPEINAYFQKNEAI